MQSVRHDLTAWLWASGKNCQQVQLSKQATAKTSFKLQHRMNPRCSWQWFPSCFTPFHCGFSDEHPQALCTVHAIVLSYKMQCHQTLHKISELIFKIILGIQCLWSTHKVFYSYKDRIASLGKIDFHCSCTHSQHVRIKLLHLRGDEEITEKFHIAPTSGGSQLPVTPLSEDLALSGLCKHLQA